MSKQATSGASDAERKLKATYEGKLATLTAINSALQAENEKLRDTLEQSRIPSTATEAEISELQEEFSRRLAVAERQALAAQDEREEMRAQLRAAAQGGSVNEAKLKEKDEYIEALHQEGEKLSKRNGELEAAARRTRAQLRDVEAERDRLTSQLLKAESRAEAAENQAAELEEELEAAQEAAAKEVEQARTEASKKLAAAKNEAGKAFQQTQQEQQKEASEALAAALDREVALTQALNETRMAMEEAASVAADRESELRDEALSLERRVRELEAANHALQIGDGAVGAYGAHGEAATSGSLLLRQLESMAEAAAMQQQAAEEAETRLAAQVTDLCRQLTAAADAEKKATNTINNLQEEVVAVRTAYESSKATLIEAQQELSYHQQRCNELETELAQAQGKLLQVSASLERHTLAAAAERQKLQESLWEAEEALRTEVSDRKELEKQLAQKLKEMETAAGGDGGDGSGGGGKITETATAENGAMYKIDNDILVEDKIEDEMDAVVRSMSMGNTAFVDTTTTSASTVPPQRIHMLQHQLRLAESARDASNEQLVIALESAEKSRVAAQHAASLENQLALVTKKLDVALEVLGEKNERVEALEEDIKDMKAIFHEQLAVAADQLAAARAKVSTN